MNDIEYNEKLKYRIYGSDKIREKLHKKLIENDEFILFIDLDRIEKLGYFKKCLK